jgi:hypothetical protein
MAVIEVVVVIMAGCAPAGYLLSGAHHAVAITLRPPATGRRRRDAVTRRHYRGHISLLGRREPQGLADKKFDASYQSNNCTATAEVPRVASGIFPWGRAG